MYMSVRNIDVVSIPYEWLCIYVCQEYRCCLCSLWVVMYICIRNIDVVSVPCCVVMYICVRNTDVVSVPCEWSCIYVCQEFRCCLCSLWVVMYICVRNIDIVSVPCEWSCICVSGISMLSVPCEWLCTCLSGRSMLSLFLVSGHVYVCQEYRCCLCSLWLVMYICVRNIAVVSVPCE